jgi:hypothetical protein
MRWDETPVSDGIIASVSELTIGEVMFSAKLGREIEILWEFSRDEVIDLARAMGYEDPPADALYFYLYRLDVPDEPDPPGAPDERRTRRDWRVRCRVRK